MRDEPNRPQEKKKVAHSSEEFAQFYWAKLRRLSQINILRQPPQKTVQPALQFPQSFFHKTRKRFPAQHPLLEECEVEQVFRKAQLSFFFLDF
jgi:hypothetical protein